MSDKDRQIEMVRIFKESVEELGYDADKTFKAYFCLSKDAKEKFLGGYSNDGQVIMTIERLKIFLVGVIQYPDEILKQGLISEDSLLMINLFDKYGNATDKQMNQIMPILIDSIKDDTINTQIFITKLIESKIIAGPSNWYR